MVSWLTISLGISTLSAAFSLIMLRRLLRQKVFFCDCPPPTRPKRAVITGATSGIGLATAHELAQRGWSLVLGCRNTKAGSTVKECLSKKYKDANIEVHYLDLTDLSSILLFAKNANLGGCVEVLINNAGIMAGQRDIFPHLQLDSNMLTNFIGPFCLFHEFLPYFRRMSDSLTSPPRVIFVTSALGARGTLNTDAGAVLSPLDEHTWSPRSSYANSKQALNLFAREVSQRFGSGESRLLNVYTVVTGGMVNTNLNRDFIDDLPFPFKWLLQTLAQLVLKTPREGCQNVIHCALSENVYDAHLKVSQPDANQGSGRLYRNCLPVHWPESSTSDHLAAAVCAEAESIYRKAKATYFEG